MSENNFRRALSYSFCFATVGLGFLLPSLWAAVCSCAVIVTVAQLTRKHEWTTFLALSNAKQRILSFGLCFLSAALLVGFVVHFSFFGHSDLVVRWDALSVGLFITVFFQSLCEEILFRVFFMRDFLTRLISQRWIVVLLSALCFSFSHWINYRVSEGVSLSWTPLIALFFLGCASSLLFFRNGHLFSVWGFHAGWNYIRFSASISKDDALITESRTFELIEGSNLGLIIATLILCVVIIQPVAVKARR